MVLGECLRLLLCLDYNTRCIRYWMILLQMPNYRYPKNCYKLNKDFDGLGRVTWARPVKQLLIKIDLVLSGLVKNLEIQTCLF